MESRKLQVCKKERRERRAWDGCGLWFYRVFQGACRGRPVGNWHWHIDWSIQTPKWIAPWLIKSCLDLCVGCQSWLPFSSSFSSSSSLWQKGIRRERRNSALELRPMHSISFRAAKPKMSFKPLRIMCAICARPTSSSYCCSSSSSCCCSCSASSQREFA